MRLLFLSSFIAASASVVSADPAPIMRGIDAKCVVSRARGEPMRCTSNLVIMMLSQAGRTAFLMTLARANGSQITLSFAGGRDQQPTLNDYTLFIDKIRIDNGDGKVMSFEATGTCKEAMNDNGTFSQGTRCSARTKDGALFELALGPGRVH